MRPLYVVENNKLKVTKEQIILVQKGVLSFQDLVNKGVIEFIDIEEEETCMVAMYVKSLEFTDYC